VLFRSPNEPEQLDAFKNIPEKPKVVKVSKPVVADTDPVAPEVTTPTVEEIDSRKLESERLKSKLAQIRG
jgi:hypothetical protein